jgi:hypothetical protein
MISDKNSDTRRDGYYRHGTRGRATTANHWQFDVRRMQRGGFLRPGSYSVWKWSRNGEVRASISARAQWGCVILSYRHQALGSDEWTQREYSMALEWTRCNYGASGHGSVALERDAGDVWQLCGAGACSFAGIAGISLTNHRMKLPGTALSPKRK